jgi:hypothetical protein
MFSDPLGPKFFFLPPGSEVKDVKGLFKLELAAASFMLWPRVVPAWWCEAYADTVG